ncbi:MAG: sigma-54-dependent Fis family transcriptional regulator, partial [Calditrichaeota bacterium]|nr:sigma-54-dependent Fis family transcriptional regulator [Calditrichota bacterium]
MKQIIFPENPVLLVDDETQLLFSAEMTLSSAGINHVRQCQDSREVLPLLTRQPVSAIVLDMYIPHLPGWKLLPQIVQQYPEVPVIILTAINEVDMAVEAMKNGAFDYLVKPVDDERLVSTIRRAIEMNQMRSENRLLKAALLSDKVEYPEAFEEIVTANSKMRLLFQYIEAISRSPLPVLVTGETGVG